MIVTDELVEKILRTLLLLPNEYHRELTTDEVAVIIGKSAPTARAFMRQGEQDRRWAFIESEALGGGRGTCPCRIRIRSEDLIGVLQLFMFCEHEPSTPWMTECTLRARKEIESNTTEVRADPRKVRLTNIISHAEREIREEVREHLIEEMSR